MDTFSENYDSIRFVAAETPPVVFIEKRKRPERRGLWQAYEVCRDEFGTWIYTPRHSLYRGESNGEIGFCNVGSPTGPGQHVLGLIPEDDWWIATFWPKLPGAQNITVDVCTAPSNQGTGWSYVDLELDPWLNAATGESGYRRVRSPR